ncbi:MAG TPA: exopolysaccharide biosynthesis polyprenyl glycosylphosphotransferase, partial [Thermoanaerobaculia bacterium]
LLGVRVEDALELYQRLHGKIWLEAMDPGRLAFAEGFRITPSYRLVKRVVDMLCAFALLALAAPVMAVVALAIKLESPGPVLFRQERVGQFGKTFILLKFRSMREDAEKDGPAWASKNDSRVTRIGGFLRKSHLDELPQAINVLRGDLSFVGPRPERPCFVAMLREKIPFFDLRLYVKPGITGWAQVRYPYCDSVQDSYEKLQYDLYYARKASPLLDLEILARTAAVMVTGRGR